MRTRSVDEKQPHSLMDINSVLVSTEEVNRVSERLKIRIEQLGLPQAEAARRCKLSTARFGNYVQGTRTPDINTLMQMARALQTSTDWLLGFSATQPPDVSGIVSRLLELEGLDPARVQAIAETVQEALKVLSALPDEGDAQLRSRIAAQAAWQLRDASKPTQ